MTTIEFKAHMNNDGSIVEFGFKNIITDYDDQRVVFVNLPEPEHSLAETMQNFAELQDEFNDFCDTMLEGFRG